MEAFITIVYKTYQRIEGLNGTIGTLAWVVASMARPIVHPLGHLWLLILAFADVQILAMEDIITSIFPPLIPIFAKVDELAFLAQSLPNMFDNTIDGFLMLVHQLPLLDYALTKLENLVNMKIDLDSSKETEIVVDINCYERQNWDEGSLHEAKETEKRMHKAKDDGKAKIMEKDIKEVERSCEEIMDTLERMGIVEEGKRHEKKDGVGVNEGKMVVSQSQESSDGEQRDPILELFDEGWQLNPLKAKK